MVRGFQKVGSRRSGLVLCCMLGCLARQREGRGHGKSADVEDMSLQLTKINALIQQRASHKSTCERINLNKFKVTNTPVCQNYGLYGKYYTYLYLIYVIDSLFYR